MIVNLQYLSKKIDFNVMEYLNKLHLLAPVLNLYLPALAI